VDLRGLMKRWFAELSLRYHPDRGGTDAEMRVVNDAYERLRKLLETA
jgi:curved DNA-binding protein CbpA